MMYGYDNGNKANPRVGDVLGGGADSAIGGAVGCSHDPKQKWEPPSEHLV